jgi:NAD(P)-dependent dehydrogenase (short-subunit alcohol dehydrogenase family)
MPNVVVTGANRGIGLEFTRQLLAHGARVFAACRQPGKALKLTELAGAHPGRLHVLPLDLARERSIAEFAREAGVLTSSLDVLVTNAGTLASGERFGKLGAKSLVESFTVNAAGPLLLSQALAPLLLAASRPLIVNLTSELGSLSQTKSFYTPSYGISKAALNMVTRLLAAELRERAIVVSVNPGWVQTDMGGQRAPVPVHESVAGMLELMATLEQRHSGGFFDYGGATMAW